MPVYKMMIFDFDGTLADSGPGILAALEGTIQRLNLKKLTMEEKRALIGPPIHLAFQQAFDLKSQEELEQVISVYREVFDELASPSLQIFPGIDGLLRDIVQAGVITGVATCKTQHVCEQQAGSLGIKPYLHYICGARPAQGIYEKDEIISLALQQAGVSKNEAVMIGDRMYDMEGAKNVGIKAIGVTYGAGSYEELFAYNPVHIADSVSELYALLLP